MQQIQDQFKKIETRYQDVLKQQVDLTEQYQTEKPSWYDKYSSSPDHKQFLEKHLQRKKKLELDLMKDNKRYQLVQSILALIDPGQTRQYNHTRYKKLKKLTHKRLEKDYIANFKERQKEIELERKRQEEEGFGLKVTAQMKYNQAKLK